ncbi:MAG: Flp pilus assembly complex ATPase component TadA [Longimicrobiales bacterium]|nr:Flp pilus assembly complex ATPase component TadA [Longimicrobiales bacterium]
MEGYSRPSGGDPSRYLELPAFEPVRPLLEDPLVTEIMINGTSSIFVEREGAMKDSGLRLPDERALGLLVDAIVRPSGRSLDAQVPYVDCRLPDGSRVNIILSPLSVDGTAITIRRATRDLRTVSDLVGNGSLSVPMARFLALSMRAKLNIIFSGGTGTGKTTALELLAKEIPSQERIIVIEDTAELRFDQPNVVRLEARRASVEGAGEVTLGDLLKNSLRMRPSRIVMGEIRGAEAFEMLQAVATGHDGCLSVLHAGSPTGVIGRLEMMVTASGFQTPLWATRKQIAAAVDVIVQTEILPGGRRCITHVTEVADEDGEVVLHDLFYFDPEGDEFKRTERRPEFTQRFTERGLKVSDL